MQWDIKYSRVKDMIEFHLKHKSKWNKSFIS